MQCLHLHLAVCFSFKEFAIKLFERLLELAGQVVTRTYVSRAPSYNAKKYIFINWIWSQQFFFLRLVARLAAFLIDLYSTRNKQSKNGSLAKDIFSVQSL